MVTDPEKQLYSDMASLRDEIPKLQSEIKSLKKRLTQLSERIENIEIMAFQDQITRLNDNIKATDENLLTISRMFARFQVEYLQVHMKSAIVRHSGGHSLTERISRLFGSAQVAIDHSSEPIEIMLDFRAECVKISMENRLGAFGD